MKTDEVSREKKKKQKQTVVESIESEDEKKK